MPVRRSLSKEPTWEPGKLFRIRQIIQVMDRQQTFHRRQNVVPVTEPESARNARVVQHLVSVVEDPCGRPAVPVAAVADRPVPDATSGTSCRHCGGSGGNTCQQCGGSGGKSCSICHGKGVISDDCILCHGDKKCTVCGGSGEL